MCEPNTQVLANPSTEVQESPEVKREELRNRGIRPYDEKVCCNFGMQLLPTGSHTIHRDGRITY